MLVGVVEDNNPEGKRDNNSVEKGEQSREGWIDVEGMQEMVEDPLGLLSSLVVCWRWLSRCRWLLLEG